MRIVIVAILAVVLGVGVGIAASIAEFGVALVQPTLATAGISSFPPVKGPPSKVVVVGEMDYNFGEMGQNTVGRHVFILRNDGEGMLELKAGPPSCHCTISSVSRQHVPTGQTAEVAVEWRPGMYRGPFRRTAPVQTNDAKQRMVNLQIHGEVFAPYWFDPGGIFLGPISSHETRELGVKFLVHSEKQCEILDHQWSDKRTAEYMGLVYQPLTAKELSAAHAQAGYQLTCVVRSGAPTGPLIQVLTLHTSLKTTSPITLSVQGHVTPDISLIGMQDFNREKSILNLGPVPQGTSRTARLSLFLVGQRRHDIKFKLTKVVPPDLKVVFGPSSKEYPGSTSVQLPLLVEVPATAHLVDLRGTEPDKMGQIVIETTHPDYKELRIFVRLAVVKP